MYQSVQTDSIGRAEWDTRVILFGTHRVAAQYGPTDVIYTHITARGPDEDGHADHKGCHSDEALPFIKINVPSRALVVFLAAWLRSVRCTNPLLRSALFSKLNLSGHMSQQEGSR